MTLTRKTASPAAPGIPYYTPAQTPAPGTAVPPRGASELPANLPTLFKPLKIRGLELANRFAVSPMCMYSADDGHLTDFHLVHLGAFALHGTALTIVEATSVTPNGRISPEDSGLWKDSQIAPLRRVADFIHSQGHKVGVQLAHAGRKASTVAPWHQIIRGKKNLAGYELGGWPDDVWAPSAVPYQDDFPNPKEMTVEEIEGLVRSFADAAKRAVLAGMDLIEIHGAHGYLITEFLSPITNQRTDKYGGSFENRTRLLIDVIKAVRAVIPSDMPLFLRISATEWMEHAGVPSWDLEQSTRLAKLLPDLGVDLLDVSSGGNLAAQRIPNPAHDYYQVDLAGRIREAVLAEGKKLLIGAVGNIATAGMARDVVEEDRGTVEVEDEERRSRTQADLVLVARQFLREPEFVMRTAHKLGVTVAYPNQYFAAPWPKEAQL